VDALVRCRAGYGGMDTGMVGRRVAVISCTTALLLLLGAVWMAETLAQQASGISSRAASFFSNRQYNDTIKVLLEEIADRPEAESGMHFLILGECYYLTGQFEASRPWLSRAVRFLEEGREKKSAEYRLACALYRVNDFGGASERIEAFLAKYPRDPLAGKLMAYKMLILSRKGAAAEAGIVALHEAIQKDVQRYDYATGMEADQILCDFYRRIGQEEKAQAVYSRIVQNFRRVISELQANNQPIPAAFEKAHDNAALQLGAMFLEKQHSGEAVKWLENVRYDPEMKQKARLMLANVAFQRQDYRAVANYLTEKGFLESVPPGVLRSDMHLLLGLAESRRPDGDAGRVEQYLRQVQPGTRGFLQAQSALGDIYREKGLHNMAISAYTHLLESSEHAPSALYHLGAIYLEQGRRAADAAAAQELFRKSSDMFNQLSMKYPLSAFTKLAREKADLLAGQGVDVSFARGDEDNLRSWEQTARDRPGAVEAAQALISIARLHFKSIVDEASGKPVKHPHYAACAAACDRLLDDTLYRGDGLARQTWNWLKAEALYLRAQCEIASVSPPTDALAVESRPVYLTNARAERAIAWFTQARQLADPKQLDLVKAIELGLLEALFKSDDAGHREAATRRFEQLEADYGPDARFQKLALDLAEWHQARGELAEAARHYAGVADRGKTLPDDDRLKLLFTAGSLYSRAARDAQQRQDDTRHAIYIYPREVVDLTDDIRASYPPLRKSVEMRWPNNGRNLAARDALVALSRASGIPFVWSPEKGQHTVAGYLDEKRLSLADGVQTVAQALDAILDAQHHRLAFDIGLTGAAPTLEPVALEREDPESEQWLRVIEIYDVRRADQRFKPLTRAYGSYNKVHGGRRAVMLYTVLQRIEEISAARVVWADGMDRQEKLAREFNGFPGISPQQEARCSQVLEQTLQAIDLRYKIVRRDLAADLYESAKDQFNKIRQINPKSRHGERSLFALALNFYNQQDYERMKIVLREYLKLFDNPSYENYRPACFWVGWAFENEKRYREACDYYARAAEERLVIYKPTDAGTLLSREQLGRQLGHDTRFALAEPVSGEFTGRTLREFADFVRLNSRVEVRLDPSAQSLELTINRAPFRQTPVFELFCDALEELGLSARVENVDPSLAERAYFRLASAYRKDNLMQPALENIQALLDRYPQTNRRRDAYKLMLDIYKGLKDYGRVLATLQELKAAAGDDIERYQLEFEIGSIWFDMADYDRAAESLKNALAAAPLPSQRLSIRDAYAKALLRASRLEEALAQFETLSREQIDELRQLADRLMAFYARFALGRAEEREFPDDALRYIHQYEQLDDHQRQRLSPLQFARATWIYYTLALVDLHRSRLGPAVEKLNAVTTSPDDFLAAEAAYRLGMVFMQLRQHEKARETFEYLLFATRSSESAVRATYALAQCLEQLGQTDRAVERYAQLIERYPLSPYVEMIRNNPLYSAVQTRLNARPEQPAAAVAQP
jgi:tetratricopeptide (TPR) repeat protein